jgi:UDP-2-acetamido-2,6-beta-L-arabino-hexul-4-ose reductase
MTTFSGKKALITGADGFIGKNLVFSLNEFHNVEILKFVRGDSDEVLKKLILQADVIIHLAGENRPKSPDMFNIVNIDLSKKIAEILNELGSKIPVIFSSSIQALTDNAYGKSKLAAEKIFIDLGNKNGNQIAIFRLPGVFGKWCKPNYNSVVATFCHNVATSKSLRVNDSNHILDLVHVDDVIKSFISFCEKPNLGVNYNEVSPRHKISLGDLAIQIESFKHSRSSLSIDSVGSGLIRSLYSTYVSYLPTNSFSYAIPSHQDERGVFVEMLKTQNAGQFSYFTAHPGVRRGGHYHHTKSEKFLVLSGKAKFKFRDIISNETFEILTSGDKPTIVDTIPGWAHDITNIGKTELIVMLWANEVFDPVKPDTVSAEV